MTNLAHWHNDIDDAIDFDASLSSLCIMSLSFDLTRHSAGAPGQPIGHSAAGHHTGARLHSDSQPNQNAPLATSGQQQQQQQFAPVGMFNPSQCLKSNSHTALAASEAHQQQQASRNQVAPRTKQDIYNENSLNAFKRFKSSLSASLSIADHQAAQEAAHTSRKLPSASQQDDQQDQCFDMSNHPPSSPPRQAASPASSRHSEHSSCARDHQEPAQSGAPSPDFRSSSSSSSSSPVPSPISTPSLSPSPVASPSTSASADDSDHSEHSDSPRSPSPSPGCSRPSMRQRRTRSTDSNSPADGRWRRRRESGAQHTRASGAPAAAATAATSGLAEGKFARDRNVDQSSMSLYSAFREAQQQLSLVQAGAHLRESSHTTTSVVTTTAPMLFRGLSSQAPSQAHNHAHVPAPSHLHHHQPNHHHHNHAHHHQPTASAAAAVGQQQQQPAAAHQAHHYSTLKHFPASPYHQFSNSSLHHDFYDKYLASHDSHQPLQTPLIGIERTQDLLSLRLPPHGPPPELLDGDSQKFNTKDTWLLFDANDNQQTNGAQANSRTNQTTPRQSAVGCNERNSNRSRTMNVFASGGHPNPEDDADKQQDSDKAAKLNKQESAGDNFQFSSFKTMIMAMGSRRSSGIENNNAATPTDNQPIDLNISFSNDGASGGGGGGANTTRAHGHEQEEGEEEEEEDDDEEIEEEKNNNDNHCCIKDGETEPGDNSSESKQTNSMLFFNQSMRHFDPSKRAAGSSRSGRRQTKLSPTTGRDPNQLADHAEADHQKADDVQPPQRQRQRRQPQPQQSQDRPNDDADEDSHSAPTTADGQGHSNNTADGSKEDGAKINDAAGSSAADNNDQRNLSHASSSHDDRFQHSQDSASATNNLMESGAHKLQRFQYVLSAPISVATKLNEDTMTYLNQGQAYEIKLENVTELSEAKKGFMCSIINIGFHERHMQQVEKDLWNQWSQQHPNERIFSVDMKLSYNVFGVESDGLNKYEFLWDSNKVAGVFIRINSISTEFTPRKHGGEKGVPFKLSIETFSYNSKTHDSYFISAACCQIKVFKPKGAERKIRSDRDKVCKRPANEQEKFHKACEHTLFHECTLSSLHPMAQNSLCYYRHSHGHFASKQHSSAASGSQMGGISSAETNQSTDQSDEENHDIDRAHTSANHSASRPSERQSIRDQINEPNDGTRSSITSGQMDRDQRHYEQQHQNGHRTNSRKSPFKRSRARGSTNRSQSGGQKQQQQQSRQDNRESPQLRYHTNNWLAPSEVPEAHSPSQLALVPYPHNHHPQQRASSYMTYEQPIGGTHHGHEFNGGASTGHLTNFALPGHHNLHKSGLSNSNTHNLNSYYHPHLHGAAVPLPSTTSHDATASIHHHYPTDSTPIAYKQIDQHNNFMGRTQSLQSFALPSLPPPSTQPYFLPHLQTSLRGSASSPGSPGGGATFHHQSSLGCSEKESGGSSSDFQSSHLGHQQNASQTHHGHENNNLADEEHQSGACHRNRSSSPHGMATQDAGGHLNGYLRRSSSQIDYNHSSFHAQGQNSSSVITQLGPHINWHSGPGPGPGHYHQTIGSATPIACTSKCCSIGGVNNSQSAINSQPVQHHNQQHGSFNGSDNGASDCGSCCGNSQDYHSTMANDHSGGGGGGQVITGSSNEHHAYSSGTSSGGSQQSSPQKNQQIAGNSLISANSIQRLKLNSSYSMSMNQVGQPSFYQLHNSSGSNHLVEAHENHNGNQHNLAGANLNAQPQLHSEQHNNQATFTGTHSSTLKSTSARITVSSSCSEVSQWLILNRFGMFSKTFYNFGGSDLLRLSKKELIEICGLLEGIRFYNSLHNQPIKPRRVIYVRSEDKEIFYPVYLHEVTLSELLKELEKILLSQINTGDNWSQIKDKFKQRSKKQLARQQQATVAMNSNSSTDSRSSLGGLSASDAGNNLGTIIDRLLIDGLTPVKIIASEQVIQMLDDESVWILSLTNSLDSNEIEACLIACRTKRSAPSFVNKS